MGGNAADGARIRKDDRAGEGVTTGKARILVIEDNRFLRRACEIGLTARGFSVTSAVDGVDGVQRALAERPDLILLDLIMPRMSGLEALRALRQTEETRQIPVLVVSNSPREQYLDEVTRLGAIGYLVKANLRLDDLANHITGVLGASRVGEPGKSGGSYSPEGTTS
jgi:two-component system sensor histidine kinase and response regulator WspE